MICNSIDQDTSLKIVKLKNEEVTKESYQYGIQLFGLFKKSELQEIVLWVGTACQYLKFKYYLKSGKVIFYFERQDDIFSLADLSNPHWGPWPHTFERHCYLKNEQLIYMEDVGKKTYFDSGFNLNKTLNDVKFYKLLLNKRYKVGLLTLH